MRMGWGRIVGGLRHAVSGPRGARRLRQRILMLAVLPLLAALRDRATQGIVAPFSPLVLNRMTPGQAIEASTLVHNYLRHLEYRVFGNRPLNLHAVFYSFFFRFMPLWSPS